MRILCKHGANPNCSSRSNLTPLHVLVFTASENIPLSREEEKALNFEFIRNLLILLLQYGLDPNVGVNFLVGIGAQIFKNSHIRLEWRIKNFIFILGFAENSTYTSEHRRYGEKHAHAIGHK